MPYSTEERNELDLYKSIISSYLSLIFFSLSFSTEVNPCGGFRDVHGPVFGIFLLPDSLDSKSDRAPIQKRHISDHHDKVSRAPGRVLLFELHVFVSASLGKSTAMLIAEVTIH